MPGFDFMHYSLIGFGDRTHTLRFQCHMSPRTKPQSGRLPLNLTIPIVLLGSVRNGSHVLEQDPDNLNGLPSWARLRGSLHQPTVQLSSALTSPPKPAAAACPPTDGLDLFFRGCCTVGPPSDRHNGSPKEYHHYALVFSLQDANSLIAHRPGF